MAEGKQEELTQKGQNEKKELQLRIEEMEEKEQALQARIEALQADNDFTNERLTALQGTEHARTHTLTRGETSGESSINVASASRNRKLSAEHEFRSKA